MTGPLPEADWNYPTQVKLGAGRRRELATLCGALKIQRPLIVTDPFFATIVFTSELIEQCSSAGLSPALFGGVQGNPTGHNVEAGIALFREADCDGVIALGGGSSLDAGKAVAFAAQQSITLWQCEDEDGGWFNANADCIAPVIAIPTTAGTGSEVGRAALIIHQQQRVKKIIWHPLLMPKTVILDPELTLGLPPLLTAATGMDALSHNLEAWCAPHFHPMAEGIALQGMKLVQENLPAAYQNGDNMLARSNMLVASSMGATAFQRGLGGMHALAHPLGALYDAHHGMLNAILMPYVLKANESAITEQLSAASRYLSLEPGFSGFLDWVLALREQLQIPHALADIDINDSEAERVGQMAVADPSAGGNPIVFTVDDYSALFSRAVHGQL
jgi:alcohol dehydrogenase class IV